jgi:hypothetical protein
MFHDAERKDKNHVIQKHEHEREEQQEQQQQSDKYDVLRDGVFDEVS